MREFMKQMLSDKAAVSFGRAGAFFIVTVNLWICIYLSVKNSAAVDIPLQWAGLAAMLFGITKFGPVTKEESKPVPFIKVGDNPIPGGN